MTKNFLGRYKINWQKGTLATIVAAITALLLVGASSTAAPAPASAEGGPITLHAAGRGNPWINVRDGVDLPTIYTGPAVLTQALEQDSAQPLALAAGDFDEDGVPDLISGYVGPDGGILTLHQGNIDSIWPHTPEAEKRRAEGTFIDAPFFPQARAFQVPEAPAFLGTGDFNGDGHLDMVAASGSDVLYLLPGDGQGGFGPAEPTGLPGKVTVLVVGEINRQDGLEDVVVGVAGPDGPQVLVFEWSEGALLGEAEVFKLPAEATGLALGQLDEDYPMDLAVAAGSEVLIVHGRDRRLSLSESQRAEVPPATVDQHTLPFTITSLAVGNFFWEKGYQLELALLAEDGTIYVANPTNADMIMRYAVHNTAERNAGAVRGARLVRVKTSSLPADDLAVIDPTDRQVHIVVTTEGQESVDGKPPPIVHHPWSVALDIANEPVAVLPMRLNEDALSDLVILKGGPNFLTVALTAPMATFLVNSAGDQHDADITDDRCDVDLTTAGDQCTVRAAIEQANRRSDMDVILFQDGIGPVRPNSSFTSIIFPVTIDGRVTGALDGQGTVVTGLEIRTVNSVVRALTINRFEFAGIVLSGAGNGGHRIEGNHIGVDRTGTTPLGNGGAGVEISGTINNVIGGTTVNERNIISDNCGGVMILDGSNNRVWLNFIGTDVNGTAPLGNGGGNCSFNDGVELLEVSSDANNNRIEGNVISSNEGHGVSIRGEGNLVRSNWIGTDINGSTALSNGGHGVDVSSGDNNTIGGTVDGVGNLISGNGRWGISLLAGQGNQIQGNFIGPALNGRDALPNGSGGVLIAGPSNAVGAAVVGARNVIAGNNGPGVSIGTPANVIVRGGEPPINNNLVQLNFIGIDVDGAALPNVGNGVLIQNQNPALSGLPISDNNVLDNVISGNGDNGIAIKGTEATGNRVLGNFIGTNDDGTAAVGNAADGVEVNDAPGNIIGGTGDGQGNVISGNGDDGVDVRGSGSTGNQVVRNAIGTDANRSADLGNAGDGVHLNGAPNNLIADNLISGNNDDGVDIRGSGATENQVQDNFIGTDVNGTAAVGNGNKGVELSNAAHHNVIGGTTSGAANLISGNVSTGIYMGNSDTTGNLVQGNFIGTDFSGTAALGNGESGVYLRGASNNTIGGTDHDVGVCNRACNLISGNGYNGIGMDSGATGNRVLGNFIGTHINGTAGLGNTLYHGVFFLEASGNTVGGTTTGAANRIAFNGRDGVFVDSSTNNLILSNTIFSNSELGIDLAPNGVTANDTGDGDTGANNLQNFPVLTSVSSNNVGGFLNSVPNTQFRLEFFSNAVCDASGHGEGANFIGTRTVTTDGGGNANFNFPPASSIPQGSFITATATDPNNNTSEFSQCLRFSSCSACFGAQIDISDVQAAAARWRLTAANPDPDNNPDTLNFSACYDMNGDGIITTEDIMLLINLLGQFC